MHLRLRQNLEESLTASWREEDVALAPKDDRLRLVILEECLPLWVELHVGPIVVEEVELYLLCVRAFEKVVVHVPVIRADELWFGMAGCVNSVNGRRLEEACDCLFGFGRTPLPVVRP